MLHQASISEHHVRIVSTTRISGVVTILLNPLHIIPLLFFFDPDKFVVSEFFPLDKSFAFA
jgi:hypothetical protein